MVARVVFLFVVLIAMVYLFSSCDYKSYTFEGETNRHEKIWELSENGWLPKLLPKNIEKLKVEYRIDNPHSFIFLKTPEDDLFSSNLKQNGTVLKSSAIDLNIIPSWVSWSDKKDQLKDKPVIILDNFYYCLLEGDYYIWR